MAFHVTMMGSFGDRLQRFTDTRGFVPEAHDEFDTMHYPSDWDMSEDDWREFRQEAVRATAAADAAIEAWRKKS